MVLRRHCRRSVWPYPGYSCIKRKNTNARVSPACWDCYLACICISEFEKEIIPFCLNSTIDDNPHEQTLFPLRDREYDILFSQMTRQGELAFRSVHNVLEQKLSVGREYSHVFQTMHWRKHVNHTVVH